MTNRTPGNVVEWLRLGVSLGQCGEMRSICLDAADEIERLREALRKIAAYNDHLAQKHFEETGSYGAFDEPGSVGIAREALKGET